MDGLAMTTPVACDNGCDAVELACSDCLGRDARAAAAEAAAAHSVESQLPRNGRRRLRAAGGICPVDSLSRARWERTIRFSLRGPRTVLLNMPRATQHTRDVCRLTWTSVAAPHAVVGLGRAGVCKVSASEPSESRLLQRRQPLSLSTRRYTRDAVTVTRMLSKDRGQFKKTRPNNEPELAKPLAVGLPGLRPNHVVDVRAVTELPS